MRLIVIALISLFGFYIHADGISGSEPPGYMEPEVTPPGAPLTNVSMPAPPAGQATAATCKAYAEQLFNSCKNEVEIAIIRSTSVMGSAALNTEGDVGQTEAGAGVAASGSLLKNAQAGYCTVVANKCEEYCAQAADYHISQQDIENAKLASKHQMEGCGAIAAVVNESNLNAASLAAHSGQMGNTADAMKSGGIAGTLSKLKGPLIGAGAVLGAMCLMGRGICDGGSDDGGSKKKSSDKPKSEDEIDCNNGGSYMYAKCEQHFINLCQANTNGTGCDEFNNHYCGMSLSMSDDENAKEMNNDLPMVAENTGVGSTFCQYQISVDYCKDDGTQSCPSCRQLEQMKSPVCQANPLTCLPGWTNEQLGEAKSYCPTDPMFMTADNSTSSSGTTTADSSSGSTSDTGNSTSELPSGDGDGQAKASSTTASLNSMGETGDTTASNYGTSNSYNPYAGLATYSVGGAFGPSLFAASSEVYDERCRAGLIDNCGPREGLGKATSSAQ